LENTAGSSYPEFKPVKIMFMQKGKIVAIVTGAISILLALAYLVLVQLLDFRGEMVPAPTSQLPVIYQLFSVTH
jgi:hypothetical protein